MYIAYYADWWGSVSCVVEVKHEVLIFILGVRWVEEYV